MSHDFNDVRARRTMPQPSTVPQRNRCSIRLQGYDYSQAGAYFVTICTQNRECLFGEIANGEMRLNDAGRMVVHEWIKTAEIRDEIELDKWVVMPNHFHGIVVIAGTVGAHGRAPLQSSTHHGLYRPAKSLGSLMAGFKSAVTKRINEIRATPGTKLWQRNYWEHIVLNEPELNRIREYIHNNPAQWEQDSLNVGKGGLRTAPTEIREPITKYGAEVWMA